MEFLSLFKRKKTQREMFDYISKLIHISTTEKHIKKIIKKINDEERKKNITFEMADELTIMWKEKGIRKENVFKI